MGREYWDTVQNSWICDTLMRYTYDSAQNMLTRECLSWRPKASTWWPEWRYSYEYSSEGLLKSTSLQRKSEDGWESHSRMLYTYDSLKNLIEEVGQNLGLTDWLSISRWSYSYDHNGNLVRNLYQTLEHVDRWTDVKRLTCTYDSKGHLIEILSERFVDAKWEVRNNRVYTNDDEGRALVEVTQAAEDGSLVNQLKTIRSYSRGGDTLQVTSRQLWYEYSQEWANVHGMTSRASYEYNSHGLISRLLSEKWSDTSWTNDSLTHFDYDGDRRLLQVVQQATDSTGMVWVDVYRRTYSYEEPSSLAPRQAASASPGQRGATTTAILTEAPRIKVEAYDLLGRRYMRGGPSGSSWFCGHSWRRRDRASLLIVKVHRVGNISTPERVIRFYP